WAVTKVTDRKLGSTAKARSATGAELAGRTAYGLFDEDRLRHHHVHALVAVDQLGDVHVTGNAGQHVSVVAAEMLFAYQEVDHLAHGNARGLKQLLVKTHADVVRGRLRARVFLAGPLAHDELQRAHQRCLQRRDIHFAVPLAGMAVTDFKQRAARMHGKKER